MLQLRTSQVVLIAAVFVVMAGLIGQRFSDGYTAQTIPPVTCQGVYMCNKIARGNTCQQVAPPCLAGYVLQCDGTSCGGGCGGTCCRCVPPGPPVQSSVPTQTSSAGVAQSSSAPGIVAVSAAFSSRISSRSSSTISYVCTDTDGGDNPAVLGNTLINGTVAREEKCVIYRDLGGGFGWSSTTECAPAADPQPGIAYCSAAETYCSGSSFNPVASRNVRCEFGCRDGLCLTTWPSSERSSSSRPPEPPPTCVDTDRGWNIYQRSYYGQTGGSTNEEYCVLLTCPGTGSCTQARVQSCGRSNFCMVYEFQCGPGGLVNGSQGGLQNCYNGCAAGACIRPVTGTSGTTGGTTGTTGTTGVTGTTGTTGATGGTTGVGTQGGTTGVGTQGGTTGVGTTGTTGTTGLIGPPACRDDAACGNRSCGACGSVGTQCQRICQYYPCVNGSCSNDPRYEWENCPASSCQ